MTAARDLRSVYLGYLACLNERRWDELSDYVADRLVYNGKLFSCNDYRALLVADTEATPDLLFVPELLVVDGPMVSCRLYFRCHPQSTFLGFEPTGGEIAFPEHVFYRFDDGRIVEVWSVIDKDSIRSQVLAD